MPQLSAHFSWEEAERSETAARRGIDNSVPSVLRGNVELTAGYMEEVRELLGNTPLRVTSWYRSPVLNSAIGGSRTSAHMKGLAVDFKPPAGMTLNQAFSIIAASDIPFDQLIEERTRDGAFWIHIGFSLKKPRREVLVAFGQQLGGDMAYRRVRES
jgi:zinc D-Ala-D-Ala carboxypeptidase